MKLCPIWKKLNEKMENIKKYIFNFSLIVKFNKNRKDKIIFLKFKIYSTRSGSFKN